MIRIPLAVLFMAAATTTAHAHFTMLLPQSHLGRKGEPVTIVYQWGHPFEHQLFDAPPLVRLRVISPDGTSHLFTKSLETINVKGENGVVTAYRLRFTPDERGDYTFIVETPPIWMAQEREFVQDITKVVVHVQAQKGWDATDNGSFQVVPLTRPYGLRAGMVFQARILSQAAPGIGSSPAAKPTSPAGLMVFCERYNPQPPKVLPPDEMITFTGKTDPNGVATCTLPTAGWWCIAVQRDAGRREHDGKDYPVRQRAILWVYVNEAVK